MDGTTTTTHGGAGDDQWAADAPTAPQPQLLATSVGDTCANCGARLAGDQRYCVECGERRGKPRYSLSDSSASTAPKPARSRAPRRPRLSGNGALIGGVAALLLAMAVGLQIGLSVNKAPASRPVQVVGLGASTTPAAGTTPAATANTGAAAAGSKSKSKSKSTAKQSATAKKLAKAVKSVPKTIPKKLQSSVKKVGGACTSGPGCSGGKFTGNFFGG